MASFKNIFFDGGVAFDGERYPFNPSAQAQEFEVKTDAVLGAIDRNPVGRILIREFSGSPLPVVIRPLAPCLGLSATTTEFVDDIGKLSPTFFDPFIDSPTAPRLLSNFTPQIGTVVPGNVPLKPLPKRVANFVPAWDRREPLQFFIVGNSFVVVDPSSMRIVDVLSGSGKSSAAHGSGSSINIWYNPETFETYTAKSGIKQVTVVTIAGREARHFSVHYQADDVLFHELVHALRGLRGQINPALGFQGFQNKEDFYAIMLTNIYLSADGRNADMRGSHAQRWEPLPPGYAADPATLYDDAPSAITDLFSELPTLCGSIAGLLGVWNPLLVHKLKRSFTS